MLKLFSGLRIQGQIGRQTKVRRTENSWCHVPGWLPADQSTQIQSVGVISTMPRFKKKFMTIANKSITWKCSNTNWLVHLTPKNGETCGTFPVWPIDMLKQFLKKCSKNEKDHHNIFFLEICMNFIWIYSFEFI